MKSSRQEPKAFLDPGAQMLAPAGSVGVVAPTKASLQEVVCLLARRQVGISRALMAGRSNRSQAASIRGMVAGLDSLQADPATEVVVLVSQKLADGDTERVLDRVRALDKPAVACLIGESPRRAWRAGAIPATRLDEAAMRAAAWIRGWDQALVSSWLEEEADELAGQAVGLLSGIGPGRRRLYGVMACHVLAQEASTVLATVAGSTPSESVLRVAEDPVARAEHLRAALADPALAVLLLDLGVNDRPDLDPAQSLAGLVQEEKAMDRGIAIVAHVCGTGHDLAWLSKQEETLRTAGVTVAGSNASAAWLAGSILRGVG